MRKTLVLNLSQENELQQIVDELIYSLKKTLSDEDLLQLCSFIIKESGGQTYKSKKDTTLQLFNSLKKYTNRAYSFSKNKIKKYNDNGFEKEFNSDFNQASETLKDAPDNIIGFGRKVKTNIENINQNFLMKSKEEKIELISVGLMGVLIFYASAGGEDFEGGIPDLDLNLGIGFHRHFISHSIIMGFIVEFLMRAGIEIINKSYHNLPDAHHEFWDKSHDYINKYKGVAIGAMWAGIGAHLLKDSGLLGHGVKAYTGIPIELSMNTHKALFAANSAASAMYSYKEMKK